MLQNNEEYLDMVAFASKIYELKNKQYNYSVAYYNKYDKIINPKLILRFDCHQINDIQVLRLPQKDENSNLAQEQIIQ